MLVVVLAFVFNLYFEQFTGDGKNTPKEALPQDADYEWIEGPKSEKEQRYFFLSNGNYFGTGVITKNLKGWSAGDGSYSQLPNPLEENTIVAAYSDSKILYGLIKPRGDIHVTVNGQQADFVELNSLSKEVMSLYDVEGYSIWYLELSELENTEHYSIKVLDEKNSIISDLSI